MKLGIFDKYVKCEMQSQSFFKFQKFLQCLDIVQSYPMCTINENVCCCSTGAASVPPKAHLMISPAVIRERDTLQMTCEVPQSQSASLCVFYLDGIEAAPYSHPSCQISLTGVQLLQWTWQSSPLEAKVGCYYTVTSPGQQIQQSAHSDLVSVTVLGEHPHS